MNRNGVYGNGPIPGPLSNKSHPSRPVGPITKGQYRATGFPGDPVPPLIFSGDQTNRNSSALIVPLLVLAAAPAFAQVANEYRQFLGIGTRKLIWFLAQAQKLDPGQYKGSGDGFLYHCRGGIDCSRV